MLIFMFVLTFLHKKVNLHGVADAPAQLEKFVHFFAQKCTIYITTYIYDLIQSEIPTTTWKHLNILKKQFLKR